MKKAPLLLLMMATACTIANELEPAAFQHLHHFGNHQQLPLLNVPEMQVANGRIHYLGKESQLYSIKDDNASEAPYNFYYAEVLGDDPNRLADVRPAELLVLVDTINTLSISHYTELPMGLSLEALDKWSEENEKKVQAYPVYIWNVGKKTAKIEFEISSMDVVVEAKDDKGIWRPIEYLLHGYCGNAYWDLLLKPDYYLVGSIYRYTGDFETELRVKAALAYSKPFRGSINKAQFNNTDPRKF